MEINESKAESIFFAALEIEPIDERAAYLDGACESDDELRCRVDRLLAAQPNLGSFIQGNAAEFAGTVDQFSSVERPGETIGRYKLMEQIGEGGMGTVFVAKQESPIRRKVALKVVKPGMDSKAVIARFEAERQALAVMDHANIAKVFDAGATDRGRPYFVMELVSGIPITEYCDEHKLTVRERLSLFATVCQAIQHAHQKGIIHRDIKPSNVLVTEQDGMAIPKVIDFGVAKAIGQSLTDHTVYTSFQSVVGTPLYMSPEQAALSNVDVDTRSDVYSLGVLLYELLTGTTPFDREALGKAAQEEVLRIIREQEPVKPSTKISTLGEKGLAVSRGRRTDIVGLGKSVRGDLDWIVMKALDKNRTRRYETASGFASDVGAFLANEAVEARPPSTWYQLEKVFQRNKVLVATLCTVFLGLFVGLGGALWGLKKATTHLETLKSVVYQEAMDSALARDTDRMHELLKIGETAGIAESRLQLVRAAERFLSGEAEVAISLLEPIVEMESDNVAVVALLSAAYLVDGRDELGIEFLNRTNLMTPTTAEDFLFKGVAQTDSAESLRWVNHAFKLRPTAGALAIRARVMHERAIDLDDPQFAKDALFDAKATETFLDVTPSTMITRLAAHHLLARHANGFEVENHRTEATRAANQLVEMGVNPWLSALYFSDIDDFESALHAWKNCDIEGRVMSYYIAALFKRIESDPNQSLRLFDEFTSSDRDDSYVQLSRAHLMVELDSERQALQELQDRLRSEITDSMQMQYLFLNSYFLLDDPMGQQREAGRLFKNGATRISHWGMGEAINFLAGECTNERIDHALNSRTVLESKETECVLRCAIGRRLLMEGKRDDAEEQFSKCIETGVWYFFEYNWAKAYLERMHADRAWPHWLTKENDGIPD